MVIAVRKGASMREAAGLYHFGLATVHYWVRRAGIKPLDQVAWNDRPSVPHRVQRTDLVSPDHRPGLGGLAGPARR